MTQKEYYDFREEENTRQVSLYRLVRSAARRWKLILLAGIILGGLMGSYKILSIHSKKDEMIDDYDTYKSKQTAYKKAVKDYKNTIAKLQANVADRLEYIENSPKMKLNAYECPMSTVNLNIASSGKTALKTESVTLIKNTFYNDIYFGDLLSDTAAKHEMSVKDLRELTTLKLSSSTGSTIRLTVRAESEETAEAIRDDILTAITNKAKTLTSVGNFTIEILSKGTMSIFDTEIVTYQTNQRDGLAKVETAVYTAQNQSSQLTKPVAVPQYSKKYMLVNGVKMGVVGLAAGMILAAIAIMVIIVQKGVILSSDEIDGEYGLRTLADFSDRKKADAEGEIDYVIARIENCLAGRSGGEIGIVGTASEKNIQHLADKLNKKSSGTSVKFTAIPGITKDAKSLRRLTDVDGIILTEEIGVSDYYGVRKEIALIADSGRELIGTVYY